MRSWILHSSLPSMSLNRMVIADPERLAVQREDALALIVLDLVVVADGDHVLPHLVARGRTVEPPLLSSFAAEQRQPPVVVLAPHRAAATQADDPPRGELWDRLLRVIPFGYGRDLSLNQPTYAHVEGWSGDGGDRRPTSSSSVSGTAVPKLSSA